MASSSAGAFDMGGSHVSWCLEARGPGPTICIAHPVEAFGQATAALLADVTGASVVSVSTDVRRLSLELMVDQIEEVRRRLQCTRWYFWGMSGGGWLAMLYARRYASVLHGIVIESACACFRARLADATCALSPNFPSWRDGLRRQGLLDPLAHREVDLAPGSGWVEVDGIGHVFRRADGPALLVSAHAVSEDMRIAMPRLWAFDARPWLATLELPALVLCGTADPIVPVAHTRRVAELIPGARHVAVEGGGHVPTTTCAPQVADAWHAFTA